MSKQKLIFVRGFFGEPKNVWIQKFLVNNPNVVRVDANTIREQKAAVMFRNNTKAYQEAIFNRSHVKLERKTKEEERKQINDALQDGRNVVVTSETLDSSVIEKWGRSIQDIGAKLVTKNFDASVEEVLQFNRSSPSPVNENVLIEQVRNYTYQGRILHVNSGVQKSQFTPPRKKGQLAVGFDLDGTLHNVSTIRYLTESSGGQKKNMDTFHRSALFTPPNAEVVQMLKDAKNAGYAILITTARSEKYSEVSQLWLEKHGISYDNYYCRPVEDFRSDYEVKKDMFKKISEHYTLVHQVDDNPQAVAAWVENGVKVTVVPGFDDETSLPIGVQPQIVNVFKGGGCVRCGRVLKSGASIGPVCAKK